MPLSAAEKQRRYRQKRDLEPERRIDYLEKQKQKYIDDLEVGKKKHIAKINERDKRQLRKLWRKKKAEYRKGRKEQVKKLQCLPTPESSPSHTPQHETNQRGQHMSKEKKRNIAKCYRDNSKLRDQLEKQKQLNRNLRKKLTRVKQVKTEKQSDTPKTKTRKLLRNFRTGNNNTQREKVKRTLFHHFTLTEELRNKYKGGSNSAKSSLASILRGKLIRKYNVVSSIRRDLGFFSGSRKSEKIGGFKLRIKRKIQQYYDRDDNSRLTSGMKETVTKNKVKHQKRVLLHTIEGLHNKFLMENENEKISYTSFSRLRPFWVLPPKESDRATCICKQHENMQFLSESLYKNQLLITSDLYKLAHSFSCDTKNLDCMYGRCSECKEIEIPMKDVDQNREVTWLKWQTVKEKRMVKNVEKEVSFTVKVEESGDIAGLVDVFSKEMVRFKQHFFNVANQIDHYRQLKEKLTHTIGRF